METRSLQAAGWGAVAGIRTFTAPALLSIAWAERRRPPAPTAIERALGARASRWLFGVLAAFELAADQWPGVQDRIAPPSLLARVLSGALVGSALGQGRERRSSIALAVATAAASSFASFWLRRAANRRLPNSASGLFEDALALGAGAALASRLPGRINPKASAFGSASDLAGALRRAEAAHGEHERRTGRPDASWPDWYAAYIVAERTGGDLPT